MSFRTELESLLQAAVPLIHVVTHEEDRVGQLFKEICDRHELGLVTFDLADGFTVVRPGKEAFPVKDCSGDTLLPHLAEKLPRGYVVILRDFHFAWKQKPSYVTRKLRNMVPMLRDRLQALVFTTPEPALPLELKDDVVSLRMPLPMADELRNLFDEATRNLPKDRLPRPEIKVRLVNSALGLTLNQARRAFAQVHAQFGCFDDRGIALVTWSKREVIRESGALEFWPAEEGLSGVGGLDLLKEWLAKREKGFSDEARAEKLPYPRGVALIGIPGTGKSLSAKMASGLWKLPLLRLDVGALFGSLLGESEEHLRQAINLAETVSPCILWIDELEKAFGGVNSGALTGGAATRMFGTFLTWMQERTTPVFVIATANDIEGLPPELMGRFDRVFFLDLPTDAERKQIFLIHLERAGVIFPERVLRMDELVSQSRGYVGREIERVVREAQFTAFADRNRRIEMKDLAVALKETVPLSKSHSRIVEELRKWKTEGRAFPASSDEAVVPVARGPVIEPL